MDYSKATSVTANMSAEHIRAINHSIEHDTDPDSDYDSDDHVECNQDWDDDSESESESESEDDEPEKKISCRHCGRKLLSKNLMAHQKTKTCKAKQKK